MKNCVVTGGAGFIGSNLVDELLAKGCHVTVIDNLSTGSMKNLEHVIHQIKFFREDIRNFSALKPIFNNANVVFHLAALGSVPRSVEDPQTSHEVNSTGTLNVLEAARQAGVGSVVNSISSAVYGNSKTMPKIESMNMNPISPYGISKASAEMYGRVYNDLYGLKVVNLRYFNVFGPRQQADSVYAAVIPKFIIKMLNNKVPHIYGDGEHSRDFTFVKNVVNANILAATNNAAGGYTFNVATGSSVTLNGLVKDLNKIMGKNIEPFHEDPRPGDIQHSLADITKAQTVLGYRPEWGFTDGLSETVLWNIRYAADTQKKEQKHNIPSAGLLETVGKY